MPSSSPQVSRWLQDGFHAFLVPFLRRHFHTIAVDRQSAIAASSIGDAPLVVFGNHPSWWDPLLAHFACRRCFAGRQFYAPIAAVALERYRVFSKLGFFGVDLDQRRGAAEFLHTSLAIMNRPGTSLWLTPEGRFTDARDREAQFAPGLAHLCVRMPRGGIALPMALELVFWEERLPECLVRFGTPIRCDEFPELDKAAWQQKLSDALHETQDALADSVIARDPDPFEPLLSGGRGTGSIYDLFRRARSLLKGRSFHAAHGDKFN